MGSKKNRVVYTILLSLLIGQFLILSFLFWGGGVSQAGAATAYENVNEAAQAALGTGKPCGSMEQMSVIPLLNLCPPRGVGDAQYTTQEYEKSYRLQVHIPGIGKTCYYPGPASEVDKWEVKRCVYMPGDQDMRHWIRDAYRYMVGIAVALAVLMIMVGGFQWILAGGSNQQISNAQSTILAAISGLVVALGSYVVLNVLDPRLVEFEELEVEPLGTVIQTERWCRDNPEKMHDRVLWYFKLGTEVYDTSSANAAHGRDTDCGHEYEFGYFDPPGVFNKQPSTCLGVYCGASLIPKTCLFVTGASGAYCVDAEKYCEGSNKKDCLEVDKSLRQTMMDVALLDHSCSLLDRRWLQGDKCHFGEILVCPGNSTRVSCLAGPATKKVGKSNEEGECWKIADGQRQPKEDKRTGAKSKLFPKCVDVDTVEYANKKANMICCFDGTNYNLEKKNVLDCAPTISQKCGGYTSKDACNLDICQVRGRYGDVCYWQAGSCLKR